MARNEHKKVLQELSEAYQKVQNENLFKLGAAAAGWKHTAKELAKSKKEKSESEDAETDDKKRARMGFGDKDDPLWKRQMDNSPPVSDERWEELKKQKPGPKGRLTMPGDPDRDDTFTLKDMQRDIMNGLTAKESMEMMGIHPANQKDLLAKYMEFSKDFSEGPIETGFEDDVVDFHPGYGPEEGNEHEGELSDNWMERDWQRKENEREKGKPWYDVEDEDKYGQVVKLVRALQDDNTEASENTLYIIRDLLK